MDTWIPGWYQNRDIILILLNVCDFYVLRQKSWKYWHGYLLRNAFIYRKMIVGNTISSEAWNEVHCWNVGRHKRSDFPEYCFCLWIQLEAGFVAVCNSCRIIENFIVYSRASNIAPHFPTMKRLTSSTVTVTTSLSER